MKTKLFIPLLMVLLLQSLSSCQSNLPGSNLQVTETRQYCYVEYANTTSKYCAIIYIDGVPIEGNSGNAWTLWAGRSGTDKMYNLDFPKDLRIELHEIANESQYYKNVYKTFEKQSYLFSHKKDYKVTIREDGVTINSIEARPDF